MRPITVIRGRYKPTTGRRWWLGGTWLEDHLNGVSWGIAGRGFYVAVVPRTGGICMGR